MLHLTDVGPSAGKLLCSTNKAQAQQDGDKFLHYPYYNPNKPYCADVCPLCKAFIDDTNNWE